jgi:hypothetical protein
MSSRTSTGSGAKILRSDARLNVMRVMGFTMPPVRTQWVLLLLLGVFALSGAASAGTTQRHAKAKAPVKVEQEQPASEPEPVAPPAPLTPAQMPARPPQVSYNNGSLTIIALNSTIGDILRAVRTQTGAVIDISGNANERVMSRFGPGTPRDVLSQLLSGSEFNYVMLGSPTDAGKVEHLILTPKSASEQEPQQAQGQAAGSETNPFPRVQPPPEAAQGTPEEESEESSDSEAQDDQTGPPTTDQPAAAQGAPQTPNQPAVKTPEQLLQELQRQVQQQQQQGAATGENPSAPNQR